MAMFHFHTAFVLAVIALAGGLTLLHFGKSAAAPLLRAAGWVLVAGSLAAAACSIYYAVRYHVQGEFDHAYGVPEACRVGSLGMPPGHGMHGMHERHPMLGPGAAAPVAPSAAAAVGSPPAPDDEHAAPQPEE